MTRGVRSRKCTAGNLLAALALLVGGGCATSHLDSSRQSFYQGRPDQAAQVLGTVEPDGKDQVLILMERGMARQVAGDFEASSEDLLRAIDRLEELETYSLSKGGATWVVNDTMQDFRGKPFERTLLHTFAALNFLALGQWEGAAVEARRLNETVSPDMRGDYPDEPFSRYVAAVSFEMIGDYESAAFQYRQLNDLVPALAIDPQTGWIGSSAQNNSTNTHELIVFVLTGHATTGPQVQVPAVGSPAQAPLYAEIEVDGQVLGQTHTLSDTWQLHALTQKEDALRQAAKTAARIAAKEAAAQSLERSDQDELAAMVRLIMIGLLERPDLRAWMTLPRWLQVARVPCPPELEGYELVLKTQSGQEVSRRHVGAPIRRQGRTYVSFHRELAR